MSLIDSITFISCRMFKIPDRNNIPTNVRDILTDENSEIKLSVSKVGFPRSVVQHDSTICYNTHPIELVHFTKVKTGWVPCVLLSLAW